MKMFTLLLLAMTGADFQMLPMSPESTTSYQMLVEPTDRHVHHEQTAAGAGPEESTSANAQAEARPRRLLVYTAAWCPPCQRFHRNVLPKLATAGWAIGPEPTNQIQVIEVGKNLPAGITAVPTFVLIEDSRQVRRHVGFLDAWGVGELVKGYSERPQRPRSGQRIDRSFLTPCVRAPIIRPTGVPPRDRSWGWNPRCRGLKAFPRATYRPWGQQSPPNVGVVPWRRPPCRRWGGCPAIYRCR